MPAVNPVTLSQLKVWLNFGTLAAYPDGATVTGWPYANNPALQATAPSGVTNRVRRGSGYGGVTLETVKSWNLASTVNVDGGFSLVILATSPSAFGSCGMAMVDPADGGLSLTLPDTTVLPMSAFYSITRLTSPASITHTAYPPISAPVSATANRYLAGWNYTTTGTRVEIDGAAATTASFADPCVITGNVNSVLRRDAVSFTPLVEQFLLFQPALSDVELHDVLLYFELQNRLLTSLSAMPLSGSTVLSGDVDRVARTLSNLSFEIGGTLPGSAILWDISASTPFEVSADFTGPSTPVESFEAGWGNDVDSRAFQGVGVDLTPTSLGTLSSNPKIVEDFEELWSGNHLARFTLPNAVSATFARQWVATSMVPGFLSMSITDNNVNGESLTLPVVDPVGPVGYVSVYLAITHALSEQLRVGVAPPGQPVVVDNLWDGSGSGAWVSDSYATSVDTPVSSAGDWTLRVSDVVATTVGSIDAAPTATFYGPLPTQETFEHGWGNGGRGDPDGVFLTTFDGGDIVLGVADAFDVSAYYTTLEDAGSAVATLSSGAERETFDFAIPRVQATFDLVGSTVTAPGSFPINSGMVTFTTPKATVPAPLVAGRTYYMASVAGDTFYVTETLGGSPVVLTSAGPETEPTYVGGDPAHFWDSRAATLPFSR